MAQPFENKSIDAIANRIASEMGQETAQLARTIMTSINALPEVHNKYATLLEQAKADPNFDEANATLTVLTAYNGQLQGLATNFAKLNAAYLGRTADKGLLERIGKELRAYSDIGTVEAFKEALARINSSSDGHKELLQRLDNLKTTKEEIEKELAKYTALGTVDDLKTAKAYQERMLRIAQTIRAHQPTYTEIDTKPFEDKINDNKGSA